jgi:hypothetical protein
MNKIPPFKLIPEPLTAEAANLPRFKWAPEEVGTRHKLGGSPDWIGKPSPPQCSCGREMTFYAQLDSISDEFVLADCGMIYLFVCFDCFEVQTVLQST